MRRYVGALLAAGLLAVVLGAVLGYSEITVDGRTCGNAFQGGQAQFANDLINSLSGNPDTLVGDCRDALSGRKTLALSLLIPGLLLALGSGVAFALPTTTTPTAPQRTRTSSPSAR